MLITGLVHKQHGILTGPKKTVFESLIAVYSAKADLLNTSMMRLANFRFANCNYYTTLR